MLGSDYGGDRHQPQRQRPLREDCRRRGDTSSRGGDADADAASAPQPWRLHLPQQRRQRTRPTNLRISLFHHSLLSIYIYLFLSISISLTFSPSISPLTVFDIFYLLPYFFLLSFLDTINWIAREKVLRYWYTYSSSVRCSFCVKPCLTHDLDLFFYNNKIECWYVDLSNI